jgi:hypothetical protein
MRFFELKTRLIAPLVVMCCLIGVGSQVAQAQNYTSGPNIGAFTAPITSYAIFSNYLNNTGCTTAPFTPTSAELLTTSCRVYTGTLAGLPATFAGQNWILASFSDPVSTIVVFPNIDHFGSPFDGYQYQIYGSNDRVNWTPLFDATSVTGAGEPFTLGTFTGTAPTTVNNVLTPQTGSIEPCSGTATKCSVGYIATFHFPTVYQFYAFGASTVAFNQGNVDQELSAVGTIAAPRSGTFAPTSGALLTINGTVGTGASAVAVNRAIYDSQIHTGTVRQVPVGGGVSNCNANDQTFPTDAYVLQGGSWTGCDPGDTFELQASGQATVSGAGYSFTITTSYTGPQCNHNSMVCVGAGASTGFLTITNSSGADFSVGAGQTGITLSGTPVSLTATNAAFCPPAGGASDTINTLANGASAVLALSTDSSFCGGFNAPQTQTLVNGVTDVFQAGNDDYRINPFDSDQLIGAVIYHDTVAVLAVPVPAGPLVAGKYGSETPSFATSAFSAGANFPSQDCIAYDDLSALGNPVCLEFQVSCTPPAVAGAINNCLSYLDTAQIDFTKDHNSLTTIGGVAFLGQHDGTPAGYNGKCPTSGFYLNNFLQYTPTNPDPISGSGRGNSCYVGTFDPTAAPIPVGQTLTQKTFGGFLSSCPVSNVAVNLIQAGQAVPFCWQTLDSSGNTIPNLSLCPLPDGTTDGTTPCTAPWVFIGTIAVNCVNDQLTNTATLSDTVAAGSSGLQLITPPQPATPFYQYNLKTVKGATGCFTPVLGFSVGGWYFGTGPAGTAIFQYTH